MQTARTKTIMAAGSAAPVTPLRRKEWAKHARVVRALMLHEETIA
jgi:hypothetical protein